MKSKDKERLQAVCLCAWLHDTSCGILSRPCTHVLRSRLAMRISVQARELCKRCPYAACTSRLRCKTRCARDWFSSELHLVTVTVVCHLALAGSIFPVLHSFVVSRPRSRQLRKIREWTPYRMPSASPSCESYPSSARKASTPTSRSVLLIACVLTASLPASLPLMNQIAPAQSRCQHFT
jgi:hypothetical protein